MSKFCAEELALVPCKEGYRRQPKQSLGSRVGSRMGIYIDLYVNLSVHVSLCMFI